MALRRPRLVLLALLVAVVGLALPAGAHTQIQRATPEPGETVEGRVDFVLLEFLDPVMPTPVIEVSGADGAPVPGLRDARLVADDVARVEFDPIDTAGTYQVDYTFVALDGAAQEGAHQFTVLVDDAGPDAAGLLAWIVGGVLVALAVVVVLARRRRAR